MEAQARTRVSKGGKHYMLVLHPPASERECLLISHALDFFPGSPYSQPPGGGCPRGAWSEWQGLLTPVQNEETEVHKGICTCLARNHGKNNRLRRWEVLRKEKGKESDSRGLNAT